MSLAPGSGIPVGTLVVVSRGQRGEQLAVTYTPCYGPGRWPFVRRWSGDRWTQRAAKARVLRVASDEDLRAFGSVSPHRALALAGVHTP
jgi:hypothetical protein